MKIIFFIFTLQLMIHSLPYPNVPLGTRFLTYMTPHGPCWTYGTKNDVVNLVSFLVFASALPPLSALRLPRPYTLQRSARASADTPTPSNTTLRCPKECEGLCRHPHALPPLSAPRPTTTLHSPKECEVSCYSDEITIRLMGVCKVRRRRMC